MSKATSSTRSVMITRSLCPRISWACCASCTLMVLSSLKIEPRGREHSNVTSWSENTCRPNSQSTPKKLSFWDLCRANGEYPYLQKCCLHPDLRRFNTVGYTPHWCQQNDDAVCNEPYLAGHMTSSRSVPPVDLLCLLYGVHAWPSAIRRTSAYA